MADETSEPSIELNPLESLFFENALACVFLIQNGVFQYVNPAFTRIFGYASQELLQRRGLADLIRAEDRAGLESHLLALRQSGDGRRHFETQGVTQSGALVDVEISLTAVRHDEQPGVIGTLRDISERKRAEREARDKREELEALYSASSRLLRTDQLEELYLEIVAAVQEDFGHAMVSLYLLGDDGRQLDRVACSHPEISAPAALLVDKPGITAFACRTGEIVNAADIEHEPRFAERPTAAGSVLAIPLKLGERVLGVLDLQSSAKSAFGGRDVMLLKAFVDRAAQAIERARLHARLGERTRQLQRFHELALMMVGDPMEMYREIASQVAELLRSPYSALVRLEGDLIRSLGVMSPGDDRVGATCPIDITPCRIVRDTRESQIFTDVVTRFPRDHVLQRRGIRTYIGVPVFGRRGEVVAVLNAMDPRDRSFGAEDLRIMNLLARRAADEMEEERREGEKTATERMLLQSEKLASLGQVLAGVAHELNNPLAAVLGLTELLGRRDSLGDDARETVARIAGEAERARAIVRNLLAFAREHEPERSPTLLQDVVQGALALRSSELRLSNIEVVTDLAPDLPLTLADPHLLKQALLNLILNAEHAMIAAHGRGRLAVRTRFLENGSAVCEDSVLRIEIEDDGPGIEEQNLGKVFEPFFTTKEVGKGTGLGLSLVHSIVQQHGGSVWVESRPGGGARFVIELPHVVAAPPEQLSHPAAAVEPGRLAGRRVLLAEDEETLRDVAREVLESEGCIVVEAEDGSVALAALEAGDFAVVVSDVKMPGVGGLEVYRRACSMRPDLCRRFLFVTGDWVSEDTARFLEETGSAHLEKPYNVDQLLQRVAEVLGS